MKTLQLTISFELVNWQKGITQIKIKTLILDTLHTQLPYRLAISVKLLTSKIIWFFIFAGLGELLFKSYSVDSIKICSAECMMHAMNSKMGDLQANKIYQPNTMKAAAMDLNQRNKNQHKSKFHCYFLCFQ